MEATTKPVQLSETHASYLRSLELGAKLPRDLKLSGRVLEGPPEAIEILREVLTELLAERGFAGDYSTTAEGELIEDLIDILHEG